MRVIHIQRRGVWGGVPRCTETNESSAVLSVKFDRRRTLTPEDLLSGYRLKSMGRSHSVAGVTSDHGDRARDVDGSHNYSPLITSQPPISLHRYLFTRVSIRLCVGLTPSNISGLNKWKLYVRCFHLEFSTRLLVVIPRRTYPRLVGCDSTSVSGQTREVTSRLDPRWVSRGSVPGRVSSSVPERGNGLRSERDFV